ncbi:hypothetical protein [Haloglomus halophilum]|uniref:hypothetical protein n=1 Tax=Haloglomus halophilum TaxID=2962672 RepID=UPI0020C963C5|nr:hypothetical protein [Haloglomus halophilum]
MDADTAPGSGPDVGCPGDDLWDALAAVGDPLGPVVEEAVELAAAGDPVAVVGAPFGGRERVLERVADRLGARHGRVAPGDAPPTIDGPTIVADAHHAYRRAVGGFEPLDDLVRRAGGADSPLVTGWTQHAWSYLLHARNIDEAFEAVAVPAVDREVLGTLVRRWSPSITFRAPPEEERGLLQVERRPYSLPVFGEREVPVPVLDMDALDHRDAEEDPEAAVVRRLTTLADGNPGVAWALWNDCVGDTDHAEVDPTTLRTPVERAGERARDRERAQHERGTGGAGTPTGADDAGLDRRAAFCCRLVLASERLPRSVVAESVDDADRLLTSLERRGYLTTADGTVRLRPAAVPDAVALTDRRRIP